MVFYKQIPLSPVYRPIHIDSFDFYLTSPICYKSRKGYIVLDTVRCGVILRIVCFIALKIMHVIVKVYGPNIA